MKPKRQITSIKFVGQETPVVLLDDGSELSGLSYLKVAFCPEHGTQVEVGAAVSTIEPAAEPEKQVRPC